MWDKIKGVSPKTIEKINNEGFESDDPDREEKGAAVLIGTKEEVERQRELIESEGRAVDLESYIRLHKKIIVPKDEVSPYFERWKLEKGDALVYNDGTIKFIDSEGNIAKADINIDLIDSARGKVLIEKERVADNRISNLKNYLQDELKKLGFNISYKSSEMSEIENMHQYKLSQQNEKIKKEKFNF